MFLSFLASASTVKTTTCQWAKTIAAEGICLATLPSVTYDFVVTYTLLRGFTNNALNMFEKGRGCCFALVYIIRIRLRNERAQYWQRIHIER